MNLDSLSIVGMHFRPPAKAILAHLPSGANLYLQREPENPYDENAVMVLVDYEEIPEGQHTQLACVAEPYGYSLEDLAKNSPWHLGYISRQEAETLSPILLSNPSYGATLAFSPEGKPLANITFY